MKKELGSFNGDQIRINISELEKAEIEPKIQHELTHEYLTVCSSLGLLQNILKEYKGDNSKAYKYVFSRCNKIQEITCLFIEFCYGKDDKVLERLKKNLNGITTEAKRFILDITKTIKKNTKNKKNYDQQCINMAMSVGVNSLDFDLENLTTNIISSRRPNKTFHNFFVKNNINPKKKFENIIKTLKNLLEEKSTYDEVYNHLIEQYYHVDPRNFLNNLKDESMIINKENKSKNSQLILDINKIALNLIIDTNRQRMLEVLVDGINQLPINSIGDLKVNKITDKNRKENIIKKIGNNELNFIFKKSLYGTYKEVQSITVNEKSEIDTFMTNFNEISSQKNLNFIVKANLDIDFSILYKYFKKCYFNKKRHNLFILGNQTQNKKCIDNIISKFGEESFKYYYSKLGEIDTYLAVFQIEENFVIFFDTSFLKGFHKDSEQQWNEKKVGNEKPDKDTNYIMSVFLNLLHRTNVFDVF